MADSGSSGRQQRHRQPHQQQQQQQQQPQQQYYDERGNEVVSSLNRVSSGKASHFAGSQPHYDGSASGRGNGGGGGERKHQRHHGDNRSAVYGNVAPTPMAPTTGVFRSGHIEVDSLYGQGASNMVVNAMNAPNNSTMQCGCENIDCPFCNLMTSVQMKESPY